MRNLAVGFAIGAGVGAGGCYFYLRSTHRLQVDPATTIWPAADPSRAALASEFGAPQTEAVRVYDGYVAAYDYRTRNPKWVLEHLTKDSVDGDASRQDSFFFEDPGVDVEFRAHLADYRNSGYDRGHMAAAADQKSSQKALDETFSMSNISPQVGKGFNRDYWARFEKFVRDLTRRVDHVYVVTGPVWMPRADAEGKWHMQHALIGQPPGLVAVPTHYYKVVVADGRGKQGTDGKVAIGAFVMPNAPIDPAVPLSAFTVPIENLEKVAGVRFFPAFVNQTRRTAIDSASHAWRQYGMQQLKPFDRLSLGQGTAVLPATTSTSDDQATLYASAAAAALPAAVPSGRAPSDGEAGLVSGMLPPPPKTVGAAGAVHLCELNGCTLPAEDFWLSRAGSTDSNNNSSTGRRGRRPSKSGNSGSGRR